MLKVNPLRLHAELGTVGGREPRWAIARKFAPEVQETRLKEIRINVGRTGLSTRMPYSSPWRSAASRCLRHAPQLRPHPDQDIRENDWVQVTRAGEVIPQVLGPVIKQGAQRGRPYDPPDRCPVCKAKVEFPSDESMSYCSNVSCPGRILESIVHFAARDAMDIRGLGYERVRALLDANLIKDFADLYEVTLLQLLALEGFAEKSAQQLVDAIHASKRQPLSILLFALGIRHVGAQSAKLSPGISAR